MKQLPKDFSVLQKYTVLQVVNKLKSSEIKVNISKIQPNANSILLTLLPQHLVSYGERFDIHD
ncbi:hypothetical protein Hanom_Chr07g00665041 [Helianthus anomalus]